MLFAPTRGRSRSGRRGRPGPRFRGAVVIRDVLEHLGGDDAVERPVGKGQPGGIAAGRGAAGGRRHLASDVHGPGQRGHVLELGLVVVEGRHPGAAAQRLEGVPAGAAAEVEQAVAGVQAQSVVIDGEHYALRSVEADEDRWSRRSRYCSTVLRAVCRHDHWSTTRCRPAAPTVWRRSDRSSAQRSLAVSASLSPGGTTRAVSPSRPTTSGSAPPDVATSGVPHAMASMAGSEKPSYSEGTTASSASAYSSMIRWSGTP